MNSFFDISKRRHNLEFFDTALRMQERVYTLPVDERLGHMKDLTDRARGGDKTIRSFLTNMILLRASAATNPRLFWRQMATHKTIAQAADADCRKFWGAGVIKVVTGKAPEPPTGEIE